jgi:hypothetical protein
MWHTIFLMYLLGYLLSVWACFRYEKRSHHSVTVEALLCCLVFSVGSWITFFIIFCAMIKEIMSSSDFMNRRVDVTIDDVFKTLKKKQGWDQP